MKEINKRAWLYARIDAPEDAHGALKGQEKELYDYAGQMGFTIAGSSSDLGGGTDTDRPGLKSMTAAARNGSFDILLVKNAARLGRDMKIAAGLIRKLGESGIAVYSPMEGLLCPGLFAGADLLPTVTQEAPQTGGMSHA